MFDSAKYRKMIEGDLAELLKLQKGVEAQRKQAAAKTKELEKEAAVIQHQINRLKEMAATVDTPVNGFAARRREVTGTAFMFGFDTSLIKPRMGIIRGVRAVVHGVNKRVRPPDVRDILVECGFPDSKNLLPEIHAALRRLVKQGEVKVSKSSNGGNGYLPRRFTLPGMRRIPRWQTTLKRANDLKHANE